MKKKEFLSLKAGDIILQKNGDGSPFAVAGNYGKYVTALMVIHVSNPSEWVTEKAELKSISDLLIGDIIMPKGSTTSLCYIVICVNSDFALAVKPLKLDAEMAKRFRLSAKVSYAII